MDREDWILNHIQGRHSAEDQASFENAMARDPALSAEVNVMRAVRRELADSSKHENAEAVWLRLTKEIDDHPKPANDNRQPFVAILRYAAVALIAVAAWQFAVVPRLGDPDAGFRTASGDAASHVLQVKFRPDVTIAAIGDVLTALEGTIADGPSTLGILRLSFADNAALTNAFEVLSARDELVELILEQ